MKILFPSQPHFPTHNMPVRKKSQDQLILNIKTNFMLYQIRVSRQGEKTYSYYKSPARKSVINGEFPIIRKSSRLNHSSAIQRIQKAVKSIFTITTLGTLLLAGIILAIVILFAFYGNGRFVANPIIGW